MHNSGAAFQTAKCYISIATAKLNLEEHHVLSLHWAMTDDLKRRFARTTVNNHI